MIPIPVPQPPPQYVPVSIEWSRKMKRQLMLTGLVLVVVSLAIGALGIPWLFFLSIGKEVGAIMLAGLLFVSVFFSFAVGALSLIGQSYIKNGWLNLTQARGLSRSSLVMWIFSTFSGVLSMAVLALTVAAVAAEGVRIDLGTFSCFIMVLLPAVLSGIAWITVIRKVRFGV